MGGGKGSVEIPESYDLDELVEAQKELNRFDAYNPWGSQTWNEDGTVMTQAVDPRLEESVNRNIAFANRDAPVYNAPWRLQNAGLDMMSNVFGRAGMSDHYQGAIKDSNPRSRKTGVGQPYPPTPELPQTTAPGPVAPGSPEPAPYPGPGGSGSAPVGPAPAPVEPGILPHQRMNAQQPGGGS